MEMQLFWISEGFSTVTAQSKHIGNGSVFKDDLLQVEMVKMEDELSTSRDCGDELLTSKDVKMEMKCPIVEVGPNWGDELSTRRRCLPEKEAILFI